MNSRQWLQQSAFHNPHFSVFSISTLFDVFNPHRFSICRSPTHTPLSDMVRRVLIRWLHKTCSKQTRGTTLFVIQTTKKNIESWNHRERQIPFSLSFSFSLSSHFTTTTEPRWSWLRLNPLRRPRRLQFESPIHHPWIDLPSSFSSSSPPPSLYSSSI